MNCPKCKKELDFNNTEMTLVSDEHNKVEVISCECGESYEVIYDLVDIINDHGDSIF